MYKSVAIGALIGIVVGIIIMATFPGLLPLDLMFNQLKNIRSGYPEDFYSFQGGSIYNTGAVVPIFFGFIGALTAFLIKKIKKAKM